MLRSHEAQTMNRFLDNIFIERLWSSLKYEEVFIKVVRLPRHVAVSARGSCSTITSTHTRRWTTAPKHEVFAQAKARGYVDNATSFGRERPGRFWP
jgi:hypothetical protein